MIHTQEASREHVRPLLLLALAALVIVAAAGFANLCTTYSSGAHRVAARTVPADGPAVGTPDDASKAQVHDAILRFEIKSKLLGALGWDAVGIDVDALDGRVLLTGQVPDQPSRERAGTIVEKIDGVQRVDNRLVLADESVAQNGKPTGQAADGRLPEAESEVRDALLESRLKARLLEQIGRHALGVEIEATSGVVTLRGRLDDDAQERIVLETVSKSPGVTRVVNRLET